MTETEAYYFTSKGGDLYQVKVNADGTFTKGSLRRLHLDNGAEAVPRRHYPDAGDAESSSVKVPSASSLPPDTGRRPWR